MNTYDRIREILKTKNISVRKMERDLGLGNGTVSKWAKHAPSMDAIRRVANYLGVTTDALYEPEVIEMPNFGRFIDMMAEKHAKSLSEKIEEAANEGLIGMLEKVPVLGTIRAGYPVYAEENILDWVEVSVKANDDNEYFALRVKGDSMAPRIMEGDTLIVQAQEDADTGDIVIAMVNGNEATVKRLVKTSTGIILQPLNNEYDPMAFTWEEIERLPVNIIGKVIQLRGVL